MKVDDIPEGAKILDVREDYEWEEGHIDGAQHLPLDQVLVEVSGGSEGAASAATDHEDVLVQGDLAVSRGNLVQGMGAWQDAEKPMVSENGQPPQVR